jgi:hypothetical protein
MSGKQRHADDYTWSGWRENGFRGPPPWRRGNRPLYLAKLRPARMSPPAARQDVSASVPSRAKAHAWFRT